MKKVKKLLQKVLGIKYVRFLMRQVNLTIARIFGSSYFLSVPFHWLTFFSFMREERAVLIGKKNYYKNLKQANAPTRIALRRNIHRLEKALIMRPRWPVFAQEFILETVEVYQVSVKQWQKSPASYDESELNWAHDVLDRYFKAIKKPTASINAAEKIFKQQAYTPEQNGIAPFLRKKPDNLPTYEQLLSLSMYRRSVRWFQKKKVSRKDIDEALLVARQAPTACNRLPYEYKIYDDPELVKKVARTPFGTAGYSDNIPVIAVLTGKLNSYFSTRDRHAIYVDSSLSAMSFAFALETKGISTCMINWPDFEPLEAKMQKLLGLKFDERPIMLIAIGYADKTAEVPYSQKKSLDVIRSYNSIKKSNE